MSGGHQISLETTSFQSLSAEVASMCLRKTYTVSLFRCGRYHIVHAVWHFAIYHLMSWYDPTCVTCSAFSWRMGNMTGPRVSLGSSAGTWNTKCAEPGMQQVLSRWASKGLCLFSQSPQLWATPNRLGPRNFPWKLYLEMVTLLHRGACWVRPKAESLFVFRQVRDTQKVLFFKSRIRVEVEPWLIQWTFHRQCLLPGRD